MRQFFLTFPILSAVRRELTWTHYRVLMRIEKSEVREWYYYTDGDNKSIINAITFSFSLGLLAATSKVIAASASGDIWDING